MNSPEFERLSAAHRTLVDETATYVREHFLHDVQIFTFSPNEPKRPDMLVRSLDDTHMWWIDAKTAMGDNPNITIKVRSYDEQGRLYHRPQTPVIYVWFDRATGALCDATWDEMPLRQIGERWPGTANGSGSEYYLFSAAADNRPFLELLGGTVASRGDLQLSFDGRAVERPDLISPLGIRQLIVIENLRFGPARPVDLGTLIHLRNPRDSHGHTYPDHRFGPYLGAGCCRAGPIEAYAVLDSLIPRGTVQRVTGPGRTPWYQLASESWT